MMSSPVQGYLVDIRDCASVAALASAELQRRLVAGLPVPPNAALIIEGLGRCAKEYVRPTSVHVSERRPSTEMAQDWVSDIDTKQAGERLDVGAHRVGQLLRSRELAGRRVGGRWFTSRQAISDYESRRASV